MLYDVSSIQKSSKHSQQQICEQNEQLQRINEDLYDIEMSTGIFNGLINTVGSLKSFFSDVIFSNYDTSNNSINNNNNNTSNNNFDSSQQSQHKHCYQQQNKSTVSHDSDILSELELNVSELKYEAAQMNSLLVQRNNAIQSTHSNLTQQHNSIADTYNKMKQL